MGRRTGHLIPFKSKAEKIIEAECFTCGGLGEVRVADFRMLGNSTFHWEKCKFCEGGFVEMSQAAKEEFWGKQKGQK